MELDLQDSLPIPLYVRLSEAIRREIERGVLRPGDRLPSFAALREEYGLHKNTVKQAHALLEEQGIVVRQARRGTFVSPAFVPRAGKTFVLGFCGVRVMTAHSSAYWMQVLEGIWQGLDPKSHLLLFDEYSPDIFDKVDGLIVNAQSGANYDLKLPHNARCVSLLIENQHQAASSVVADDYAGAKLLAQHLLALGHRRIAFLGNRDSRRIMPERLRGYRAALCDADIRAEKRWAHYYSSTLDTGFAQAARAAMQNWLKDDWNTLGCTALLCQNDETAIGAMQALQEAGLNVPRDVSVTGFDGTASEHLRPRLTTIEIPLREIGRTAVELLRKNSAPNEIEHLTLPVRLSVGESTAAPKGV